MAKKKKGKKKLKKQSLTKNIFLFLTSLSMFVGATLLFYNVIHLPGIPFDLEETASTLSMPPADTASKVTQEAGGKNEDTPGRVTSDLDYSFYDILNHKEHSSSETIHYCIQLGTFDNYERAQTFVADLKEKRIKCTIRERNGAYLVQWGNFPSASTAERYRKKLSKETGKYCTVAGM
jgi:hypothetical protein